MPKQLWHGLHPGQPLELRRAQHRHRLLQAWASSKSGCGKATTANIALGSASHINAAFGYIEPGTYTIYPIDNIDVGYFRNITNLKTQAPSTKVWLSLGGWTFSGNDSDAARLGRPREYVREEGQV